MRILQSNVATRNTFDVVKLYMFYIKNITWDLNKHNDQPPSIDEYPGLLRYGPVIDSLSKHILYIRIQLYPILLATFDTQQFCGSNNNNNEGTMFSLIVCHSPLAIVLPQKHRTSLLDEVMQIVQAHIAISRRHTHLEH